MTTYWVGSNITAIRDHEFEIIITSLKHIFIIKIRTITIYTFLPMRNKFLCSVAKSCPTLCKPMNCRTPDFPVLYHLLEFAQTHVHWAIQPSHPLLPPLPPALSLSHDFNCEIKRYLLLARKAMTNLDIVLKSRDITLPTKVCIMVNAFSSSQVWMWEVEQKERWAPKNWCFWAVVLEKILESPVDCKEVKLVNPKGNQLWIFIGRTTDAEAEASVLWPPDMKIWLIGKDPDAG